MRFYPIYLDLQNKKVIVIGGGSVAFQKIKSLLEAKANIVVISPQVNPELNQLIQSKKILYISKKYERGDLQEAFIVFGATNNAEINRLIHEEAIQRHILFNAVDQPDECDFIVPAKFTQGNLTVSISTSGVAPFLSKFLKNKLEKLWGPSFGWWVNLMGQIRTYLIKKNQKEKLMPFFEREGENILLAFQKEDCSRVSEILKENFGEEILQIFNPTEEKVVIK